MKTILIALQFVCLTLSGLSQSLHATSAENSSFADTASCSVMLAQVNLVNLQSLLLGRNLMATTGNCTISGTVTGLDGVTPLQGIKVFVYKSGEPNDLYNEAKTSTGSNGTYRVEGLIPGSYTVGFSGSSDGVYGGQFYNNKTKFADAVQVVLANGATVTGINASLKKLGKITGTISNQNGSTLLLDTQVYAYLPNGLGGWDFTASTIVNFDGTYSLNSLSPGNYRIWFYASGGYRSEYYNNVTDLQSAVDIAVDYGSVVSGIGASLDELGKISGTVTGPNGVALASWLSVTAYRFDSISGWVYANSVSTQSDGSYKLTNLAAGIYRVGFSESYNGTYKEEFYNDVSTIEAATDITVSDNITTSGISASLTELGRITGKVTGQDGITPLGNVVVTAYRPNGSAGWESTQYTYTDSNGSYKFKGLKSGVYRIKFSDSYNNKHSDEFYNNAVQIEAATDITVADSTTMSGINASLTEKAKITGTVTGPNRVTPLKDIQVTLYRLDRDIGWTSKESAYTRADGGYSFRGLDAGRYRLRFFDSINNVYANKYYLGATNLESATDIVVAEFAAVGGINIAMGDTPIIPITPIVPIVPIVPIIPVIPPIPVIPVVAAIEVTENGIALGLTSTIRFKSPKGKTTATTKYLTIKNVGRAVLNGLNVTKKGLHSANFSVGKLTATSLAPGASTTLKIIFKPSATGNRNATMMISSTDPTKNPFVIQLVGNSKKKASKNAFLISGAGTSSLRSNFDLNSDRVKVGVNAANGLNYRTLTVYNSSLNDISPPTVEVSSNLIDWFSGNAYTTVITDSRFLYKVRDNTPVTDESQRFIRLKAEAE